MEKLYRVGDKIFDDETKALEYEATEQEKLSEKEALEARIKEIDDELESINDRTSELVEERVKLNNELITKGYKKHDKEDSVHEWFIDKDSTLADFFRIFL